MNILQGEIIAREAHGSVCLLTVQAGGVQLSASLLAQPAVWQQWECGRAVSLQVPEMDVAIAKDFHGSCSIRNCLPAQITAIESGQILSRILLSLTPQQQTLAAVITTRAVQQMQLQVGDAVQAMIKSSAFCVLDQRAVTEPV